MPPHSSCSHRHFPCLPCCHFCTATAAAADGQFPSVPADFLAAAAAAAAAQSAGAQAGNGGGSTQSALLPTQPPSSAPWLVHGSAYTQRWGRHQVSRKMYPLMCKPVVRTPTETHTQAHTKSTHRHTRGCTHARAHTHTHTHTHTKITWWSVSSSTMRAPMSLFASLRRAFSEAAAWTSLHACMFACVRVR